MTVRPPRSLRLSPIWVALQPTGRLVGSHGGTADGRIWNCNQARHLTGPQLGPGLGASPKSSRPRCRPDLRLFQSLINTYRYELMYGLTQVHVNGSFTIVPGKFHLVQSRHLFRQSRVRLGPDSFALSIPI